MDAAVCRGIRTATEKSRQMTDNKIITKSHRNHLEKMGIRHYGIVTE